jgi:hypothetical protein
MINTFMGERRFHVARIERGGVELKDSLEIATGDQIADLRVVLAYANSVLRGQVKVEGGVLPKGARLSVHASRTNQTRHMPQFGSSGSLNTEVDANGRFVFEDVLAGEYQITVIAETGPADREGAPPSVTQTVTVAPDAESTVMLVLDLSKKDKEKEKER